MRKHLKQIWRQVSATVTLSEKVKRVYVMKFAVPESVQSRYLTYTYLSEIPQLGNVTLRCSDMIGSGRPKRTESKIALAPTELAPREWRPTAADKGSGIGDKG